MAESKNIFIKSKMNKDLDDRLLQQGEYRNAVNIQVSKSESEDVGALENILGNIKTINTGSNAAIVGYLVSEQRSTVYLFTTNNKLSGNPNGDYDPTRSCQIIEYSWNGTTFDGGNVLVFGAFLNFWEGSPLSGVNLLESFLFFTDNRNQPRKINIDTARQFSDYYKTEDDISVAKYTPYVAPILYQESTLSPGNYETTMKDVVSPFLPDGTTANPYEVNPYQGDPDYLEDKFIRFGYRFQYDDNEYSVFSPFTQECFIPQQDGYFLEGDEQQTVASTVVSFLENKVNQITLRIPMPYVDDPALPVTTLENVVEQFKIKKVEILYKESNEIRVLVVDTLSSTDITNQWIPFNLSNGGTGYLTAEDVATTTTGSGNGLTVNIRSVDAVTGEILSLSVNNTGQNYQEGDIVTISTGNSDATITIGSLNTLQYTYSGTKPFKTLPEAQTVRVYDKVPVVAKTQEIISNRVVYGNFQTKHTPPSNLNYNVGVQEKQAFSLGSYNVDAKTSIVEYPNHNLKQNRNYQAGFVFADRFGRATSTVLSNAGTISATSASQLSTVYSPYNDDTVDIPAWPGDALVVQVNTEIDTVRDDTMFYPGVYNGDPTSINYNPLGLYSWKIVVKQQEQEYYTVYLPSAMKGNPYFTGTPSTTEPPEQNASFVTIINDNINKIPRDLTEVGPQDKSFRSSVILYGRVENTESTFSNIGNEQYYPERRSFTTNVIEDLFDIFDVADFDATGQAPPITDANNPYYSFFRSESNPFIGEFITSQTANDQFGITNITYTNSAVYNKFENLTIVETDPVESRLDIYWETSTSGTIADLNTLVAETGGTTIFSLENFQFDFAEDFNVYSGNPAVPELNGKCIVNKFGPFYFNDVQNNPINDLALISFEASNSNGIVSAQSGENNSTGPFRCIRLPKGNTYIDSTGTTVGPFTYDSLYIVNKDLIYWNTTDNNNGLQTYTFSVTVEDTTGAPGINVTKTVGSNQLANIDTTIVSEFPTPPAVFEYGYSTSSPLVVFTGSNGSYYNGSAANNQAGLQWSIDSVTQGGVSTPGIWQITADSLGNPSAVFGVLSEVNYGTAVGAYTINVRLTGPDGTSDTTVYEIIIGEEVANGSFEDGSTSFIGGIAQSQTGIYLPFLPGNGNAHVVSFHNNPNNFGGQIPLTLYPSAANVGWNNGDFSQSCNSTSGGGSGTNPYLDCISVRGPSGGYGLSSGTGYIRLTMRLSGTVTDPNFYNSTFELIRSSSIEYRSFGSTSWSAAEDIEGNILSLISSGGTTNPIFSDGKGYAATPSGGFISNVPRNIKYGCYDFTTSANTKKGQVAMWSSIGATRNEMVVTSWAAIGNSPVYNLGTGFGEYRLTTNNLTGNATKCSGAPSAIYNQVKYSLDCGDFYYGFGNNRAFSYRISTTPYGSITSALNASINSISTQVYAREPIPRYVTQFYTDAALTNKLDLGTASGPAYFAYRPSNITTNGASLVGNAGSTSSRVMAEACEMAAGEASSTNSTTQDKRIWAAYFLRQGTNSSQKLQKTAQPKQG